MPEKSGDASPFRWGLAGCRFLAIVLLIVVGAAFLALRQSYIRQRGTRRALLLKLARQLKSCGTPTRPPDYVLCHPYPMWSMTAETLHFLEVNDTAVRSYGYSRRVVLAMTWWTSVRPRYRRIHGGLPVSATMDIARPGLAASAQGRQHSVCRIMAFEYQRDGRPQELILAVDITDRHRMEEALQESQASLQALVDNAPSHRAGLGRRGPGQDHGIQQ